MNTIWKYPLKQDMTTVEIPYNGDIIHFGLDPLTDVPTIWAKVDPGFVKQKRHIAIVGTGFEIGDEARHIGTVQSGSFVWHAFET